MQALSTITGFLVLPFRQWRKRHAPKQRRQQPPPADHEVLYGVEQGSVGTKLVYRVKNRVTGRIVASWFTYAQADEHARRLDAYFVSSSVNDESIARFQEGVLR